MFHEAMAAKVPGKTYLHEALSSLPLDSFVVTSSWARYMPFPHRVPIWRPTTSSTTLRAIAVAAGCLP
ncbi:hypothetical protein BDV11DRAFT_185486 [Aspergillus similis]